jgi:hypothetical protein
LEPAEGFTPTNQTQTTDSMEQDLFEKLTVDELVKKIPRFLWKSKLITTSPYSEPAASSSYFTNT